MRESHRQRRVISRCEIEAQKPHLLPPRNFESNGVMNGCLPATTRARQLDLQLRTTNSRCVPPGASATTNGPGRSVGRANALARFTQGFGICTLGLYRAEP